MQARSIVLTIAAIGLAATTFFTGNIQVRGQTPGNSGENSPPAAGTASPTEVGAQTAPVDLGSSSEPGDQPGVAGAPRDVPAPGAGMSAQSPSLSTWNKSVRYAGSALRPRMNDVNYTVSGGGGCIHVTSGNANTVWNLPVNLPEGVQVQWARMYFYDTSTTDTIAWLTKYDSYGNLIKEWPIRSSGSTGVGYTDVELTPADTIDYYRYSYMLNWRPMVTGTSMQLCGFQLYYLQTSTTYLPAVTR